MATATASRLAVLAPRPLPPAPGRRRHAPATGCAPSRPRALSAAPRGRVLCLAAPAPAAASTTDAGQDRLQKVPISNIRNFCIIAHIDHGKSTLADKLLELTGTVQKREMKEQFLDNMDLERERGITIKLQAARMRYIMNKEPYCLNLIDTPGHVDFSYEGVEAQTLANVYLALENNLEIIPVLNKIDLPGAEPDRVAQEIEEIIGLDCKDAIRCSAKEGIGITEILDALVTKIPPPKDTAKDPLRALIFDSYYDPYRGVIVYFRVIDGSIKKGDKICFMANGKEYISEEIGVLSPSQMQVGELYAGEFEPESSSAMGFGFRCGFLGLLHMEIVQERLEREYNLNLIITAPSVVYRVNCADGETIEMLTPKEYIGSIMELAQERRGEFKEMNFLTESRAKIIYELPLAEMVGDFFDQLKSRSKGYASMEYSLVGYRESQLVKLDIQINGDPVEALSTIVHRDKAYSVGRALTQKLKELIPRQMFRVPIQVIASEALSAIRKDVLSKCYGGDISRKKKLLKKQAEGKKRMKAIGRVDVPQEAFMAVLKLEKEVL
ncbi:Translation factor GUF1-like protein, chloroplastic [Dichanthelium oligosanthes]|uniref:Translation factor GUF1 homolog, mitochondrial n=1 Tax=Dichanthelium oligosanthes TaxID=888268 RepID=A0A1E5WMX4_9POAL|nr:Translation factor GUF1-like protein, chloroplastic [Dichanthelium oligosanthes]